MVLKYHWLLITCCLVVLSGMSKTVTSASDAITVLDFHHGLSGWQALDQDRAEGKTTDVKLVSVSLSEDAHSRPHSLQIDWYPGDGWAHAWVSVSGVSTQWAKAQVDEIAFWMRGDGSEKEVKVCLQQWTDDLSSTFTFEVPISLKNTEWRKIVIPLARFQESNPDRPLRLPDVITFQINGSGAIGPARMWIDDVVVRNARGKGGAYSVNLLDKSIAEAPVPPEPRLGNWVYPGTDKEAIQKFLALGMNFSSTDASPIEQQRMYLAGIVTNYIPNRPSGADLIAGLGLGPEDMDQDSQGRRAGEGVETSVFHKAVPERFCKHVRERIRPVADAPWVHSFMLSSPISMYGEAHYSASTGGQYLVFSRPAKDNFRRWIARAYRNDLSALSRAWGKEYRSWEEIVPPEGPQAEPGKIDTRRSWSDFIHWYNWWLDKITLDSLKAARRETKKPIAAMLGGPKVGFGQGISLGNIGPVVRMLGKVRPSFLNDTDAQSLFSTRYSRAACSQYGIKQMQEHTGPPFLIAFHQYNMLLNVLSCGAEYAHLAHTGQLFDDKHWFSRTWKNLAPLVTRYRTSYTKSDAAIFHSYMTSWYRPDRSNADAVSLYDSTNTLWTADKSYPSWGRALASPDVIDDAMVEDGALTGRKLLLIPNSSVTVTSRKAVKAIRKWVSDGGTIIGFGEGCLAYTVELDRSLKATPGMAGLIPVSKIDKSNGGCVEHTVGKGRALLYLTPADPSLRFVHEMMPVLEAEAARAGVRRMCKADDRHEVNLIYCGIDSISKRHLFTADFIRRAGNGLPNPLFQTERSFTFAFDPSLTGEAELVGITDSFESCEGGTAEYNAEDRTLVIRFSLPGKLTLNFGKSRGGLADAKHPLLLWRNDDLWLVPTAGHWQKQTQGNIRITADGDLTPRDIVAPYVIHGSRHSKDLGAGPAFRLSLPKPGSVTVHVNSVPSAVTLVMKVDGKEALREVLPDKDNWQHFFAQEYDRDFTVDVPAGDHLVQIENLGEEWVSVDRYVFRGLR